MGKTRNNISFGQRLKKLRKMNGLSQVDLAYKLGYESTGTMSLIETGKQGMDRERIIKAAKILKVPPAVLMSDKNMDDEELEFMMLVDALLKNKKNNAYYETVKSILKIGAKTNFKQ